MASSTAHRTWQSTLMGTCTCATGPTTGSRFSLRTGQFITSLLGDANEMSKVTMTQASSNPETMRELRETTRPELLGRFSFPTGVTFDTQKQRLIVTDSQRGRLQIYNKSME